jgi:hypothetical protein
MFTAKGLLLLMDSMCTQTVFAQVSSSGDAAGHA